MAFNNALTVINTTNQSGIREELADWIAVADAKSTPFISMAPKGKDLGNMEFSWQVDGYSAPQAGGTQDGTDVNTATSFTASNASNNRQRWKTYAEVFRRFHRTGFVANEMNVAGVSSETARAVAKRLVEIKRDMEAVFTCTGQAAVLETSTAAFRTSSLGNWLNGTATTYPTVTAGLPTSDYDPGSGAVITTATSLWTESTIQDVLAAIYGETGQFREYDAILGTKLKRAFTDLCAGKAVNLAAGATANGLAATSVRTFNTEMSANTLTAKIDVFEGDFGTIRLHPSTFLNTISGSTFTANAFKGYIIPFDMVEVRYAALPKVQDLPDAGGGPIKLIQAIAGLCVKNCQGFGMFNGTA